MLIGHILKDRYTIYDRLGSGGAATVYLARDGKTSQIVVVKLIHNHLVNEKFVGRFQREIEVLQRIDSPHVVKLYDWGLKEQHPDLNEAISYAVLEFVEGHSIADLVDTRGRFAEAAALQIARQVAVGLKSIHALGIVHRDIKSQNIFITPDNQVKIIDFGLAKGGDQVLLTGASHFAGTLYYAPPEQILEAHGVDQRADIYALGVVLYEMLMARLPVAAKDFGTVASRIIAGKLDPITGVSAPVEQLVTAMLALKVSERIGSAGEVIRRIDEILASEIVAASLDAAAREIPTIVSAQRSPEQEPGPEPPTPRPAISRGQAVRGYFGPYGILAVLGSGGMSSIYRAIDPKFNREVAVKVLTEVLMHDRAFVTRFELEARIVAAIEQSAIVPVYDYGIHEERPYLVMRYMSEGSVADRLQERPYSFAETLPIVDRIAGALDTAHRLGIVHRDVKPSNILFDKQGDAYLGDFGIAGVEAAQALDLGVEPIAVDSSTALGTPAYMAPELWNEGQGSSRSDIYSFGITLYEMLAGTLPYPQSELPALFMAHLNDPIPDIRQIRPDAPDAVQTVIERALAKNPDDRYQHPVELAKDFRVAVLSPWT